MSKLLFQRRQGLDVNVGIFEESDSKPKTSRSTFHTLKPGEYIKFGRYPQKSDGKRSLIEWLVLEISGNEALLLSRYALDCRQYHHEHVLNMTWDQCDLRKWLNNYFLKTAFSEEEIKRIKVSELRNDEPDNPWTTGNTTRDRVFCLSIEEAGAYFLNNKERVCYATEYARMQGATCYRRLTTWYTCEYWLRSPGSGVGTDGTLNLHGIFVDHVHLAVRPALRIIYNLESSVCVLQSPSPSLNPGNELVLTEQ